ncbi:uncharacterized protein LOC121410477 [Lytechinus variegatus]|uniref:uncharacterized protein LOC121410477 n=1 Tax=Lytechinus variegatus TaxID=7654 RepID=UPI001BB216E6|nr:uncharacterized protein LOC121410477 [Lytechinus variegatus]
MVRREGSRFGINTNHNIRRLPFPFKNVYAQQNVVIETKLDAEGRQSKRKSRMALRDQLLKDTFNIQASDDTSSLSFSLNKAKRWEVLDDIKEESNHSNHYIIREHHILQRSSGSSSRHTCVEVFDSAAETRIRSPKKKYAKATDLIELDQSKGVKEDADFGKKNSKRSRKRRAHQEEEQAENLIQYDVSRVTPRETYQSYAKSSASSESRKRNSRNRSKKLDQCKMSDVYCDGLWEFSEFSIDEEEEDFFQMENTDIPYQMETKEAESYRVPMDALVYGAMSLSAFCYHEQGRQTQHKPIKSTKDRVFPIDEKDAVIAIHPEYIIPTREKRATKKRAAKNIKKHAKLEPVTKLEDPGKHPLTTVLEKPSIAVTVHPDDITEQNLKGKFGDCLIKGQCMPSRYAINISQHVIDHLASNPDNFELSMLLQQSGHNIFTILEYSLDPFQVVRHDGRLVESIRMKICGVDEGEETLTGALSSLVSDRITDVVDAMSQSVALLPAKSYHVEKEISNYSIKPALVVGTVQTTLGWNYHTTNANKAIQMEEINDDEPVGESVSCGASIACETCSICYEELDEEHKGTALVACNHWFCDECWRNHLNTQINQGNVHITCPEYKCTVPVDKVTLMSLVPSKVFSRYHNNQTNSALMLRSELHWCPMPSCGRLLKLSNPKRLVSVNCECGTFWCSLCKQEAHWPATCQQAKLYRDEAKGFFKKKDNGFIRSISTKPCPRCKYPIEKYYGCNHMVCKCGYDFCWDCGQAFDGRHYDCHLKKWRTKVYSIHPEDIVEKTAVELAIIHHKERTRFACHRRIRKARKLAIKMVKTEINLSGKDSKSTSALSMETNESCQLTEVKKTLVDVANFISEAEFVLEHLEILLSSTTHHSHNRIITEHKTRLIFITQKLHKIFRQGITLSVSDIEYLLNCGKDCLRWIALSTKQLTNTIASTDE